LLHKGVTPPIVGVEKTEHIEEAVNAIDIKLDREDIERLEEPYHVCASLTPVT
jgi:aryl-alcohol dehydrogenase-like predicted oxidoreductase